MATGIITAICSILALALGIWRWVKRIKSYRRKMAEEGKAKIEKALSADGSASDLLDGFNKLR
jgi:uncharacterized membrane protein YidH (DUF202 family)